MKKTIPNKRFSEVLYKELYNTLYTSLCVFSNRYLNNLEKSKDIVQEVFIRLWKHHILLEDKEAIRAYLYVSVRNRSLDYLKSKEYKIKNNLSISDLNILDSDAYFEKEVLIEEVARLVDEAIKTLPKRCKEVVEMSMRGYQNQQISEELNISINTVKSQKKIAYHKLRPLLKNYHLYVLLILTT